MPTYEYECRKCGHEFERFQSMTEPPLKRCPKCRGVVRRIIGRGAGIIFKGSGFYETDYKRKPGQGDKAEKTSGSETGTGDQAPAKPAADTAPADKKPADKTPAAKTPAAKAPAAKTKA